MYAGTLYGNWEAIITLQQFVIIADESGLVDMTPPAIAAKTSIPLDIIEKGIQVLEQEDKYSRSGKEEGKRIVLVDDSRPWGWQIVNYKYYRDLASREEKKIADKERIAEKRNKNKDVADCRNVSQVVADVAYTDTDTDTNKPIYIYGKTNLPENINPELWKEWMDVRKKKKAINSETALKGLINALEKIVDSGKYTADSAIQTAIENSWKTVKLGWLENQEEITHGTHQRFSKPKTGADIFAEDLADIQQNGHRTL